MSQTAPTSPAAGLPLHRIALTVLLPFAGGYFLSYLFRTVNAVIAPDLIRDLQLTASDLGLLTAAYYVTFSGVQLPVGALLDRFGPRRVQAAMLLLAATGALLFSVGQSIVVLIAARALVGAGVAVALMSTIKAITLWLPRERWALWNGIVMMTGGLGALVATTPVEAALHLTDWRGVFAALAGITVLASGLIFFVVPDRVPDGAPPLPVLQQLKGFSLIFRDRFFWRVAPMVAMCLASGLAIQTLWAGPWLRDVAGLDRAATADHLFVLAFALMVGFGLNGVAVEIAARFRYSIVQVMGAGAVLYLFTLAAIALPLAPNSLWPLIGFGLVSNTVVVGYVVLSGHFPLTHAARANTALNLLAFGGAFFAQAMVGRVLDMWPVLPGGHYNPEGYRAAFGVLLGLSILSVAWFFWSERRARQR